MSVKTNSICFSESGITVNGLIPIEVKDDEFDLLMSIYNDASMQVLKLLNGVRDGYYQHFNRKVIDHVTSRIKTKDSILAKMKKKNLQLTYQNLIENINDIAGVRVVCATKEDVYSISKIIEKIPNWNLLKTKDYIKNPKKSGYSGYHMVIEVPVKINNVSGRVSLKNQIFVKVEIQLRTMAMDFWAANEHRMKYKTNKKLSFFNSKRLAIYAKILNVIDNRFNEIGKKQQI